ncbi:hypothetical protein ACYPKM_01435 [Pseudomonas aeruginosa]
MTEELEDLVLTNPETAAMVMALGEDPVVCAQVLIAVIQNRVARADNLDQERKLQPLTDQIAGILDNAIKSSQGQRLTHQVISDLYAMLKLEGYFQQVFEIIGLDTNVILEKDAFMSLFEGEQEYHEVMTLTELMLGIVITYEDE